MNSRRVMNGLYWVVIAIGIVAVGYQVWRRLSPSERFRPAGTVGATGLPDQVELQLVLIGATTCHGADSKEFQLAMRTIQSRARAESVRDSVALTEVGVGLDWDPQKGLAFLKRYDPFDMWIVGANWVNEGAVKYVWRDVPGEPTLPQLLLVERSVGLGGRITIGPERVVWRQLGANAIIALAADSSALLPSISRPQATVAQ